MPSELQYRLIAVRLSLSAIGNFRMATNHVVLVEPQIPQNTGNITRLCACTGAQLTLVGQLGFRLDDKLLSRSAMDYKQTVQPAHVWDFDALLKEHPKATPFYLTTKATQTLWEADFPEDTLLVFGSETTGLPEAFLAEHESQAVRIPMLPEQRSLNLSNAVSIVLYEAMRQQGFQQI